MPKMKTRRATAKRFRVTGSGKFKKGRSNRGHLLTRRASSRMRKLRGTNEVRKVDENHIKHLLPYGS